MPRYRVIWFPLDRKPFSLGMSTFNDDEAAIAETAAVCKRVGAVACIMRPDRKQTVAILDTEGNVHETGA